MVIYQCRRNTLWEMEPTTYHRVPHKKSWKPLFPSPSLILWLTLLISNKQGTLRGGCNLFLGWGLQDHSHSIKLIWVPPIGEFREDFEYKILWWGRIFCGWALISVNGYLLNFLIDIEKKIWIMVVGWKTLRLSSKLCRLLWDAGVCVEDFAIGLT